MNRIYSVLVLLASISVLAGCNPEARGFALPPGDAEQGKETFVDLGCNACHSVKGSIARVDGGDLDVHVVLGGEVTRVKTYGDLVTSIINPSHKLSRGGPGIVAEDGTSNMPVYNDIMTVQQMIDLTAMLQASYSVIPPRYTHHYFP